MKIELDITDDQVDQIVRGELQAQIDYVTKYENIFSEDWKEDLAAFRRVLQFYSKPL